MTRIARVPRGTPRRSAAPHAVDAAAHQWVAVGPMTVGHGQARGSPRVSGKFRALAVSSDGKRVYAGSAQGGIWYSADGGLHWQSLDFYSSATAEAGQLRYADALTVGAIAVHWGTDAASDVVYAGAGEHRIADDGARNGVVATAQGVGIRVATGPAHAAEGNRPWAVDWRLEAAELMQGVVVNRLVVRQDNGNVWAATSIGLFRRSSTGAGGWEKLDTTWGNAEVSDVVVVLAPSGSSAPQERVYAAAPDGRVALSIEGGTWQAVNLPPFVQRRDGAAAPPGSVVERRTIQRMRLAVGPAGGPAILALAQGPRLWRIEGDAAARVTGLPDDIFDAGNGEQSRELALAAHPTDAATIAVGGRTYSTPVAYDPPRGRLQAGLFKYRVMPPAAPAVDWSLVTAAAPPGSPAAEWIGEGLPVGVCELAWVAGATPTQLWVAGEAGIFRSADNANRGSFAERNTGLPAIDSLALAQSGRAGDVVVLSSRGHGLLGRVHGETWKVLLKGPCAGVAIDPLRADRIYAQAEPGSWKYHDASSGDWLNLEYMRSPPGTEAQLEFALSQQSEKLCASPLGRVAFFAADNSVESQLALGTDRIWFRQDSASTWVTLPTGSDPYAGGRPDRTQDLLDPGPKSSAVITPKWGSSNRLYVLTNLSVSLLERDAATGRWKMSRLYDQLDVRKRRKIKVPPGQIPDDLALTALEVHDATKKLESLYVGTSGNPDEEHLWWFDGASQWIPTGLRLQLEDSPIHAVVVDPLERTCVYVGTDAGVWKGVGTFPGNGTQPTWVWTHFSDALPESPCVDLAITSPDDRTQRLLRVALAGGGMWEVTLDETRTQGPELYLQACDQDTRREAIPLGGRRDPFSLQGAQIRLDASPDIRVSRPPAVAPSRPMATRPLSTPGYDRFVISNASDPYDVWLMQSALRKAGEDIDPDAGWSGYSDAALARQVLRLFPLPAPRPTPQQVWNTLRAGHPMALERDMDQADLALHVRDEPDRWPKGVPASCVAPECARVHVVAHSRHWAAVAHNSVAVALLCTPYGRRRSLANTPALPADWAAQLRRDLTGPLDPSWMAGSQWSYADPANPFRRTAAEPFDPRCPQAVSFDVTPPVGPPWDSPGWLLLAVLLRDGDTHPFDGSEVAALVRSDGRVAARSVRRAALLAEPLTVYPGMDISRYPTRAAMEKGWRESNAMVTGLYLDSPFRETFELVVPPVPPPGCHVTATFGGHNRFATNPPPTAPDAWMRARSEIWPAWGLLPIYWGQQDPRNGDPDGANGWHAKGPFDLRAVMAQANAQDAAAKALAAGFGPGAVIYIDWEISGPPIPDGIDYLSAFWRKLAELGYRPGIYCRPNASPAFRELCPGLFVWNVHPVLSGTGTPPNAVVSPPPDVQLVFRAPELDAAPVPDVHLSARQWRLDFAEPLGNPVPEIFATDGAGVRRIDGDVTVFADPSFPERRVLSTRITGTRQTRLRGGRLTATSIGAERISIYAVRSSQPMLVSGGWWELHRMVELIDHDAPYQWNPLSVPAAVRFNNAATPPESVDAFLCIGFAEQESEDSLRIQSLRRTDDRPWLHETIPDAGREIDPLSGLAAVTRGDQSIDVFAVVAPSGPPDQFGRLAAARFDPSRGAWSTLEVIGEWSVRRSNRPAALSRSAGLCQVFWVDDTGRLSTSTALAAGGWAAPRQIGRADVEIHPFANIVGLARDTHRMDALYVGRESGTAHWGLFDNWWTDTDEWGPGGANSVAVGIPFPAGLANGIEPLCSIAACVRDADNIDVFVVGSDGLLYQSTLNRAAGTWTAFGSIPAPPAIGTLLASVDAACSDGAGNVQVVVTGRDGNVYITTRTPMAPAFNPLIAIAPIRY